MFGIGLIMAGIGVMAIVVWQFRNLDLQRPLAKIHDKREGRVFRWVIFWLVGVYLISIGIGLEFEPEVGLVVALIGTVAGDFTSGFMLGEIDRTR